MKVNIAEWIYKNFKIEPEDLEIEMETAFSRRHLGKFKDFKKNKNFNNIPGLYDASSILDRLIVWARAEKRLNDKLPTTFSDIHNFWMRYVKENDLILRNIYIDFNFLKRKRLKINFE